MPNIVILASGSGSNAQRIAEFFSGDDRVHIPLILSNNPRAYVLERAQSLGIPARVFSREEFYAPGSIVSLLQEQNADWIVLAGFLWKVPDALLRAFPGRIINIHPALLPDYGGKGMYGHHVHEAVLRDGRPQSGITIHYVNEHYDAGEVILQARCPVLPSDTPDSLAARVHTLEYAFYPVALQWCFFGSNQS